MSIKPQDARRLRIQAMRRSYESDPRIRCIRYQMEECLRHGDALMYHHKFPSPELVAYVKGIGEAYR